MAYRCDSRVRARVRCCRRASSRRTRTARLKVYLDCNNCFGDYIREEVDMVEYVRDPAEADVHILVSQSDTGSGGTERAVALIGARPLQRAGLQVARAVAERRYRRHAAAAARDGDHDRPAELSLERRRQRRVDRRGRADRAARPGRPCDRSVELLGDERAGIDRDERRGKQPRARPRRRDRRRSDYRRLEDHVRGSRSSTGARTSTSTRTSRCAPMRNERDFDGLVARSLNDHWSVGGRASIDSSTFENIAHSVVRRAGDRIQPVSIFAIHAPAAAHRLRRRPVLRAVPRRDAACSKCPTR